jgi:hypothetical protein
MPITFENDEQVIVYALERIIFYARSTQQIFGAQCVWWLAKVIGLEEGLVNHIHKLHGRTVVEEPIRSRVKLPTAIVPESSPAETREEHQDKVLKECEEYLMDSRRL